MNTAYPCPHCGSLKDTWFSRSEPMGFICSDCGKDVDETHDHIVGLDDMIPGGSIPDPIYSSPGDTELDLKGYKCPHCNQGTLRWCHPHEPWSDGNWICGRCDSTFCDSTERPRPIITEYDLSSEGHNKWIRDMIELGSRPKTTIAEKPKSSPMMGFHEPVNCREIVKLVREVLSILNETEESDSGSVFHPTTISSCRTMNVGRLREIFGRLERIVNFPSKGRNSIQ